MPVTDGDPPPTPADEDEDQDENESKASKEDAPQSIRAVSAGKSELPFTGFATIPLLLGGLALLAGGLALRRTSQRTP
ncbi:MAG: hypothetical protein WKF48_12550 [Solirubrobacteraceae bacterium]